MPVLIMITGSILALIGLVLLVKAIIGRQLSDHPFCRKCRYDLIGLNLSAPSTCPECGNTVDINSRSVMKGHRRIRFLMLSFALVITIVGSAGIGFSSLKRHPALENIEWQHLYQRSPEPALRFYESLNDEEAVHELWRRMTKGTVTDKGLRVLIDRSMQHIADPKAGYDYIWGSVLLYALYDNQLTDAERIAFIEGSVYSSIHLHAAVSDSATQVHAVISYHGVERFMGSWLNTIALQRQDRPVNQMSATSDFRILCTPHIQTINGNPPPTQPTWTSSSNDWAAIEPEFATSRIQVPFPIDEQVLDTTIAINYVLMRNDVIVHSWQQSLNASIQRAEEDIQYAQQIEDPTTLNPILSKLGIYPVNVPTQIELGRGAKDGRSIRPTIMMHSEALFDHQLLGNIRFRIGNDEIPYQSIEWKLRPHTISPRERGMSIDFAPGWGWSGSHDFDETLDYFELHQDFWERAIELGKVDVIIDPDPIMAEENPRIVSYINRAIIFRDVPISLQIPRILARTNNLTGKPMQILRWGHQNPTTGSPQPIYAQLLETD